MTQEMLACPAPRVQQATLESFNGPLEQLESMGLVELLHTMAQAHNDSDQRLFAGAYHRALTHARRLTGDDSGLVPAFRPADPDQQLLAVQRIGAITREWRLDETPAGFQISVRSCTDGRRGPWSRSAYLLKEKDRETAARQAGARLATRPRILFTETDDGRQAADGAHAVTASVHSREL